MDIAQNDSIRLAGSLLHLRWIILFHGGIQMEIIGV